MRNVILCAIISTALQKLGVHVFFIAQFHMGRCIFANFKIPEHLFCRVSPPWNSFVFSRRHGWGGKSFLKKHLWTLNFSEMWNFSYFWQVLPDTTVLPASFIKNSNAAAWIYPLGFIIKCRVLHCGLAHICVALLMFLGIPLQWSIVEAFESINIRAPFLFPSYLQGCTLKDLLHFGGVRHPVDPLKTT